MNDNDIIKALKHCANTNWIDECEGCPLYDTEKCINTVMQNALDLINRQKAEIAELKQRIETLEMEEELRRERDVALKEG